jgi:hypothetical protein
VLVGGLQKILAPFASRVDPLLASAKKKGADLVAKAQERVRVIRDAEALGFKLSAGQKTGHKGVALLEALPQRFINGVEPTLRFVEPQIQRAQEVAMRFADEIAPGTSRDLTLVGQFAKEAGERRLVSAKGAADRLYQRVNGLLTPDATFPVSNLQKVAQEISQQEARLAGVRTPVAGKAGQIAGQLTPEAPQLTVAGQAVDPASLPAQLIQQLGLDQPRELDFQTIRTFQSRLGALMDSTPNREAKRQYAILAQAVSDDIQVIGEQVSALKPMLEKANTFYRTQVAERFYDNLAKKIVDDKDATALAGLLIAPRTTPEAIQRAQEVVGRKAWKQLTASWLDDIATRKAVDPQTQTFSIPRFLTETSPQKFSPQVMTQILGPAKAQEFEKFRKVLSQIAIARLAGINPSETARGVLSADQVFKVFQLGAAGGLAGMGLATVSPVMMSGALASVTGPKLLGKLLFSETGIKWLSEGMRLREGTKAALTHLARFPVIAARVGDQFPFDLSGQSAED